MDLFKTLSHFSSNYEHGNMQKVYAHGLYRRQLANVMVPRYASRVYRKSRCLQGWCMAWEKFEDSSLESPKILPGGRQRDDSPKVLIECPRTRQSVDTFSTLVSPWCNQSFVADGFCMVKTLGKILLYLVCIDVPATFLCSG